MTFAVPRTATPPVDSFHNGWFRHVEGESAAADSLSEASYEHVYSILEGMEGKRVILPDSIFHLKRTINGWRNAGPPWTYDLDPTRMRLPEVAHVGCDLGGPDVQVVGSVVWVIRMLSGGCFAGQSSWPLVSLARI
jgi:hypothetical protein